MPTGTALELFPIPTATLSPSALAGVSIYLQDESKDTHTLYRGAEYPVSEDDLQRLRDRKIDMIYVESAAKDQYREYLKKVAFSETTTDPAVKVGAVAEVIRSVLQDSFESGDAERIVQSTRVLSKVTSKMVQDEDFTTKHLMRVLHHDYGTFTHSANVALYAGMLASEMGYSSEDLEQIVMGGLLHDLGKLEIEEKILCKPDKLDDTELRVMRRHPLLGFIKLAQRKDLTFGQLMMVYQHHERIDGAGYPVGIDQNEIHPWAKLCSVVDVYEALTSNRPYRKALPTETVLSILKHGAGKAFDPDLVSCWIKIIHDNSMH
jgi:putative nucleotidyltransferase with HDIG domain